MYSLNATANFRIDRPPNTYIFDIVPLSDYIAAISSDKCLRLIDPLALSGTPVSLFEEVHPEITSLNSLDSQNLVVCTSGRDGRVNIFDFRARTKVAELRVGQSTPVLSLTTCSSAYAIAAGTQLVSSQASVIIWDIRHLQVPMSQYVESHSDDVTELQYHPTNPHILLSGSTDGLVNLYDTSILEEEDALHQTINHGSSIYRAGFLTDTDIFALSHDEKLSMYKLVVNPDETVVEPPPVHFGDMRQRLECDYVAKIIARPGGGVVGLGSHRHERFDLLQLKNEVPWKFMGDSRVALLGAHGADIVRSFCFLDKHKTVMTCGEDGQIKAWQAILE